MPGWTFHTDWPWNRFWQTLAPWIGHHVRHRPNASTRHSISLQDSDSWLQWIQVGSFLVLTLLVLTGAADVIAGLPLLFRRTTTLSAMATVGIVANVPMMSLCYDVPVRINSSHFLLMAGLLVADDGRRHWNPLQLKGPIEPQPPVWF